MSLNTKTHAVLVKALGLGNISEEEQEKIVESSGALIYQAVLTRAMEELQDESLDEFEKIINGEPSPEIIFEFFYKRIPNFDNMIEEEAKIFIEDGANIMNQIGK